MKIFKKLLSRAVLALGLLVAPLAQAWPVSLYILVDKELKHINVLIGDHHAQSPRDKQEALFLELTQEAFDQLLANKNVAFIIEGNKELVQENNQNFSRLLTVENVSFLDQLRLYSDPKKSKKFNALLSCSDWRTKTIFDLLLFFSSTFDKAAEQLKNENLSLIKNYYSNSTTEPTDEMHKLYPKIIKSSPLTFITKIKHYSEIFFPLKKVLQQNYEFFLFSLKRKAQKHDSSLQQIITELEKMRAQADLPAHKTTPNRKKLSGEIVDKLTKASEDIKALHNGSDQKFLEAIIESAKENNSFAEFNFSKLIETHWFKTLIEALADYGFVMAIKTSYPQRPTTITYAGDAHIENIAQHFIKEEGYKVAYQASTSSNEPLFTANDYSAFFEQLALSQKEIINLNPTDKEEEKKPQARKKIIF